MSTPLYRDRSTGAYPVTLEMVRQRVNALFGDLPDSDVLDLAGVDPVVPTDPPEINAATQMLVEGMPVKGKDQAWHQVWDVEDLPVDPYAGFVPVPLLRQRLEKLGLFDDFAAYLAQYPTQMMRVLSLERGVGPAYPDILTAFDTMEVPQSARDYLMADPSVGVPDA